MRTACLSLPHRKNGLLSLTLWGFAFTPTFPYSFHHSHLYKHQTLFCGNHVSLFAQKRLLELTLTHALLPDCSPLRLSWMFWLTRQRCRMLFCMINKPPFLQSPFFRTLVWFPSDLQGGRFLSPRVLASVWLSCSQLTITWQVTNKCAPGVSSELLFPEPPRTVSYDPVCLWESFSATPPHSPLYIEDVHT